MDRIQPHLDRARKFVLDSLPADRNGQLLLAGGVVSVASVVLSPLAYHYFLGRQISHTYPNASARSASVECQEISSFPPDFVDHPKNYRVFHDKVVRYMPKFTFAMSNKNEELFTRLLRHNMLNFSRSLQAYYLWYSSREPHQRHTFSKEHIESLNFQEGDEVCGIYYVAKRTPFRVEFALNPLKGAGPIEGLVIWSIRPRNEGAILMNETVEWVKKEYGIVLPLERWLLRFMHSLVMRYTTITGARYFEEIAYIK